MKTRLREIYINYETETDLKHSKTFLKIRYKLEILKTRVL